MIDPYLYFSASAPWDLGDIRALRIRRTPAFLAWVRKAVADARRFLAASGAHAVGFPDGYGTWVRLASAPEEDPQSGPDDGPAGPDDKDLLYTLDGADYKVVGAGHGTPVRTDLRRLVVGPRFFGSAAFYRRTAVEVRTPLPDDTALAAWGAGRDPTGGG